MNEISNILDELRRIHAEHADDGDGGYAAVTSIRRFWRTLQPAGQNLLKKCLGALVIDRDVLLWTLAWEALVQEGASDAAETIAESFKGKQGDLEWVDAIVLGLLRLRYRGAVIELTQYTRRRLKEIGPLALPLVAALAHVASKDSIAIAAQYIVQARVQNSDEQVEKYVPSFVGHYLSVEDSMLSQLILEVRKRDERATAAFAAALVAYLAKPWMIEELGEERSSNIRTGLRAASKVL